MGAVVPAGAVGLTLAAALRNAALLSAPLLPLLAGLSLGPLPGCSAQHLLWTHARLQGPAPICAELSFRPDTQCFLCGARGSPGVREADVPA